MAKQKPDQPQKSAPTEEKKLRALYDKMRREFTAADLQKYTEIEEGIPLEQVIAEMEDIRRKFNSKKAV